MFAALANNAVIFFYLGKLFDHTAPFFNYPPNAPGRVPWQQTARLLQIGTTIFELRHEPGFTEICRRLSTRSDERSAFFEAQAALMFKDRDFVILAREETGSLGMDFDFAVATLGALINVEATALTVPKFSETTIVHALGRKRSQLPNDAPAVIVCFVPGEWGHGRDLTPDLASIALRFFRGTKRINHLLFVEDQMVPFEQGGGARMHIIGFRNSNARLPCAQLDEMMMFTQEQNRKSEEFWAKPPAEGMSGTGDFFLWVDWLRGRLG